MNSVSVLPFRFHRAAAELIAPEAADFYQKVARSVFGGEYNVDLSCSKETIPLYSEMKVNPDVLRAAATRLSNKWGDSAAVIIDLTSASSYALPTHHVVNGILGFIEADRSRSKRKYVMLVPMMFAEADIVMEALRPFLSQDILGLLADNGDHLGLKTFFNDFRSLDYVDALVSARKPKIRSLRDKLVRFPGHFFRYSGDLHTHCVDYFYDGSLPQRELIDIMASYFFQNVSNDSAPIELVYHSPVSRWLESAVLGLASKLGLEALDLERIMKADNSAFTNSILLIVPLVDTGETLKRVLRYIRNHSRGINLRVLAILSTSGGPAERGKLPVPVEGEVVEVDYLLKVDQHRMTQGECAKCTFGVPRADPLNPDPYTTLSAEAFWSLALEVEFSEEKNVPGYRGSLGVIPQFERLGRSSGAYLAYKINKLLSFHLGDLPSEVAVICPAEGGAEAITDCLESVFNMTIIRVPKPILDLERAREPSGRNLRTEVDKIYANGSEPSWLISLRSLDQIGSDLQAIPPTLRDPKVRAIILDEINVKGETRRALTALAAAFDIQVLCYLSMIDFSEGASDPNHPVLTLYKVAIKPQEVGAV